MRKKRAFSEGAFYHVTSRTNNKIRAFEKNLGRKIILMVLHDAKRKFRFTLTNFCIMPTHFHLMIRPAENTNLSQIIQWIKIQSAKFWNNIHGSTDHFWGHRFFSRIIKNQMDNESVMTYINQNAVTTGLVEKPEDWKASGAFFKSKSIKGFIDLYTEELQNNSIKCNNLPQELVKILPSAQIEHITKYYGIFLETTDYLVEQIQKIPDIGGSNEKLEPLIYLRYFNDTADYLIFEYDHKETMYGKVRYYQFPEDIEYRMLNLSFLLKMKFDLSWKVTGTV